MFGDTAPYEVIAPPLRTVNVNNASPMGNFYTNYTLRGPDQQQAAAAMAGRRARIAPSENGCVVVFDEASDEQDTEVIAELGTHLSRELQCPVLAVLNHDDDILWYQLHVNGELVDEYNSSPDYFEATDEETADPAGGDAQLLCDTFGATDAAAVEAILRKPSHDPDGYVFAFQRHRALVQALGLPGCAVATSYASFDYDDIPESISADDVLDVE
jgi:hypothetical protein